MIDAFQLMERQTIVAPLGLRFHDAATGATVADGLMVVVYRASNPTRRVSAFPNRTGTFVLHHAPGLRRELELGAGDEDYWTKLPPPKPFVVEVRDTARRFLPFTFEVKLPARGIYRWELGPQGSPPPEEERSVPLYSAPTRRPAPGMAVIRMDLWDALADKPAAWAVVEALIDAPPVTVRGFADERGRVALVFPYPEPPPLTQGSPPQSPPAAGSPSFTQQIWTIHLAARYVSRRTTAQALPDLRDTLAQGSADLWADSERTRPLTEIALRYGRELVVQSHDATDGKALSKLLITPAGSPP